MLNFVQGATALQATQTAMAVVGHNIANANTPGYARQVVRFAERDPIEQNGFLIGQGVKIADIQRLHDALLQNSIGGNTSAQAENRARLELLQGLEAALQSGHASLHDQVAAFFDSLEALSVSPHDVTLRDLVVDEASELASEFNALSSKLTELRQELQSKSESLVAELNARLADFAAANQEVATAETSGKTANDLRGHRDQALAKLTELIDAELLEPANGPAAVLIGGGQVQLTTNTIPLRVEVDATGNLQLVHGRVSQAIQPAGGELTGILEAHNSLLGEFESQLLEFTQTFVQAVDTIHASGIGTSGPLQLLRSERSVADASVPLSNAGSELPLQAGDLYITVTELATGQQTLHQVAVDPATQSLADLATQISGINRLQAAIDTQTNGLTLTAETGFAFDFTGRPETLPAGAPFTGTAVPRVEGVYAEAANETLVVQAVGSGSVGDTDGLTLEVRDLAGNLRETLDVGRGYNPDWPLQLANGVTLRLSSGSINAGDSFTVDLIGQPDSTGLLAALGLNSFFTGNTPATIGVSQSLLADSGRLATSSTGQPADGQVVGKLVQLRETHVLGNGTLTLEAFLRDIVADVGRQTLEASQLQESLGVVGEGLEARRQELSGVDPNEELIRMLELQRAFEAASRWISTVDEMIAELMQIIR